MFKINREAGFIMTRLLPMLNGSLAEMTKDIDFSTINFTVSDGIAFITLNRPRSLNAINPQDRKSVV